MKMSYLGVSIPGLLFSELGTVMSFCFDVALCKKKEASLNKVGSREARSLGMNII